jgi:hypothetical protein
MSFNYMVADPTQQYLIFASKPGIQLESTVFWYTRDTQNIFFVLFNTLGTYALNQLKGL